MSSNTTLNPSSTPKTQLAEIEQEVLELRRQVQDSKQVIEKLSSQLINEKNRSDVISKKLKKSEQTLKSLNSRLWEIYGSRAWRIVQFLWKIKLFLIPPDSWRADIIRKLYSLAIYPKRLAAEKRKLQEDIDLIKASDLFDGEWYLNRYPDVSELKMDPAKHYLVHGGFEGRDPGPKFSSAWYFNIHPDVWRAKLNPLLYYLNHEYRDGRPSSPNSDLEREIDFRRIQAFHVVPYYLNRNEPTHSNVIVGSPSIAVHLYINNSDMLALCAKYLNNIPLPFDLFLSMTEGNDPDTTSLFLRQHVAYLRKIVAKHISDRGRDLAPLIVNFGRDLLRYDFVAHIHTSPRLDVHLPTGWFSNIMDVLLGSHAGIVQIFELLSNDAKFVYPAPNVKMSVINSSWGSGEDLAINLLPEWLNIRHDTYPLLEFPQDFMFWAKSEALRSFFEFPVTLNDFPVEPDPADGAIFHFLERVLLISAQQIPGKNYRIHLSTHSFRNGYYEQQRDYSQSKIYNAVKVLSFYDPQYYSVTGNDVMEWTKVQLTSPLFFGHYQPRIPHDDIGYYSLNKPEVLKKQAELMKCAGVHGQIFHHYWSAGGLIFEKPAQMLLSDKSIGMPFCFCWFHVEKISNSGVDKNDLLKKQYSRRDATEFINYLIPFFKDDRYIKIGKRPVLFLDHPSFIPDFSLYKDSWEKICVENDLEAPYLIALSTMDAESPSELGMDAGCESLLCDQVLENVQEINDHLYPYRIIHGSVFSYSEIADYMTQESKKNFVYFRSLFPSWDTTPELGTHATIVYKSTPEKFQEWLEILLVDAQKRLPDDQRFVVVKAWNGWEDGTVLEPDVCFGYAYLNSIGRALSGIDFSEREYLFQKVPKTLQVAISLGEDLLIALQKDENTRRKMLTCISHSSLFSLCGVFFEQEQVAKWMAEISLKMWETSDGRDADYTIQIKNVCYFSPDTFENMLKMALCYDAGLINPVQVNDPNFDYSYIEDQWETTQISRYLVLTKAGDIPSIKCCVDAGIFISEVNSEMFGSFPKVSTIIRFSKSGDSRLLRNALYTLIAQVNCSVQPILALQDISGEMLFALTKMLDLMPWDEGCYPVIKNYSTAPDSQDLRSLMLNETFKSVETKYTAFLDYDDTVFHDAYAWLISRLVITEKNASFGLIYNVVYSIAQNRLKDRTVFYDYGKDYGYFLQANHSPIHGIMFNMDKIDRDQIKYHKDMKYMEDYYLTLQIFTQDGTDWDSLKMHRFIGDYYHYEDKYQTLALLDDDERGRLVSSPEYEKCKNYIIEMKTRLRKMYDL